MRRVASRREAIEKLTDGRKLYPSVENLPVETSIGRRSALDINAPWDLPVFPRSTLDGYAVNHLDVKGISESMPAYLRVIGEVKVGELPNISVSLGEAVRVFTGSYIPLGADAVVMEEFVEESQNMIEVYKSVSAGENILAKGEDWSKGTSILRRGEKITLGRIGVLSAYGFRSISVFTLRVGIVSTGDELVNPGEDLTKGKIYDVNSYVLFALLKEWGATPRLYGIVPDDLGKLERVLRTILRDNDIAVLSGGSSIGIRDYTKELFKKLGGDLLIDGLNISPGKPTLAGWIEGKPVFGLPGHPVSSVVASRVFMLPTLETLLGYKSEPSLIFAPLLSNLPSRVGVEEFVCARFSDKGIEPIWGKSGAIGRVAKGGFLIRIPEEVEGCVKGEVVEVWSI